MSLTFASFSEFGVEGMMQGQPMMMRQQIPPTYQQHPQGMMQQSGGTFQSFFSLDFLRYLTSNVMMAPFRSDNIQNGN